MTLKGTQTEKNLLTAFAGESQARNRYTLFCQQSEKRLVRMFLILTIIKNNRNILF